ncbi:hypothetical protein CL648_04010 [bacterium]|nr:hypothetical protein [bacterium]
MGQEKSIQNRQSDPANHTNRHSAQTFASLINEKLTQKLKPGPLSTTLDTTLQFQNSIHSSHSVGEHAPIDAESELLQALRKKLNRLKRLL